MFEIAMKMLFCLLIAALLGGLIGYLIGKIQKCEKRDNVDDIKPFSNVDTYIPQQRFIESKTEEVEVEKVDENTLVTPLESEALLNIVKEESGLNENEKEPDLLKEPIDGEKDDLKEISGIGIKLEKVLNELGIYYFEQIANWGEKELNWIDNHLVAFKGRARREKWVEQAKVLAEGGTTEFSKRVKKGEIDRY